jgi:hypothetical protein
MMFNWPPAYPSPCPSCNRCPTCGHYGHTVHPWGPYVPVWTLPYPLTTATFGTINSTGDVSNPPPQPPPQGAPA